MVSALQPTIASTKPSPAPKGQPAKGSPVAPGQSSPAGTAGPQGVGSFPAAYAPVPVDRAAFPAPDYIQVIKILLAARQKLGEIVDEKIKEFEKENKKMDKEALKRKAENMQDRLRDIIRKVKSMKGDVPPGIKALAAGLAAFIESLQVANDPAGLNSKLDMLDGQLQALEEKLNKSYQAHKMARNWGIIFGEKPEQYLNAEGKRALKNGDPIKYEHLTPERQNLLEGAGLSRLFNGGLSAQRLSAIAMGQLKFALLVGTNIGEKINGKPGDADPGDPRVAYLKLLSYALAGKLDLKTMNAVLSPFGIKYNETSFAKIYLNRGPGIFKKALINSPQFLTGINTLHLTACYSSGQTTVVLDPEGYKETGKEGSNLALSFLNTHKAYAESDNFYYISGENMRAMMKGLFNHFNIKEDDPNRYKLLLGKLLGMERFNERFGNLRDYMDAKRTLEMMMISFLHDMRQRLAVKGISDQDTRTGLAEIKKEEAFAKLVEQMRDPKYQQDFMKQFVSFVLDPKPTFDPELKAGGPEKPNNIASIPVGTKPKGGV